MAVIVNITHETGDLSQYTSSVTDSGDLSVAAGAALAGTGYGLSALIDGTGAIYGEYNFVTSQTATTYRLRIYIDPNGLAMADTEAFQFVQLYNSSSAPFASINLQYTTAAGYGIRATITDDGAVTRIITAYTITDAPHYLEMLIVKASTADANDGYAQLWVDGVNAGTTGLRDFYTRMADFDFIRVGAVGGIDAGTSGTFYLDELVVNDDGGLIGPALNHYTLTADVGSLALSGVNANLLRGYTLTADIGSYSLTGIDISFLRTYILWAAIGNYLLTGVDAILTYMSVSNAIGRVSAHTISPYGIVASNMAVSNLSESESANSVESSEV